MKIDLNLESAAVLLRCLSYGENATSQVEEKSGVASLVIENVNLLRAQVCREVSKEIIQGAAHTNESEVDIAHQLPPDGICSH